MYKNLNTPSHAILIDQQLYGRLEGWIIPLPLLQNRCNISYGLLLLLLLSKYLEIGSDMEARVRGRPLMELHLSREVWESLEEGGLSKS